MRREIELGFAERKEKVEGLGNYIDGCKEDGGRIRRKVVNEKRRENVDSAQ